MKFDLTTIIISALVRTAVAQAVPDLSATNQSAATVQGSVQSGLVEPAPVGAPASNWQATRRSAHQTEYAVLHRLTNSVNGKVRVVTNSVVELCVNLNVRATNGDFQPANPAFTITEQGAEANGTAHHVRIRPDLSSPDAIRVEKDGLVLASHPLCIGYFDPNDGRTYLLADITNGIGYLTANSEIVFSNCFSGLRASIRYKNSKSGLQQDLLLEESPGITPQDLGFGSNTRLELFSEFLPDTPLPDTTDSFISEGRLQAATGLSSAAVSGAAINSISTAVSGVTPAVSVSGGTVLAMATNAAAPTIFLRREMDANVRPTMLEPDFSDQNLTFDGKMRMGAGRAFSIDSHGNGQPGRDSIRVGKHFESITDGGSERRVLIEAVIFRDAQNLMRALPVSPNHTIITNASNFPRSTNLLARSSSRLLPPRHLAQNSNQKFRNAHRRRW